MMKRRIARVFLTLALASVSACAVSGRQNFDQGIAFFNQGRFASAIPYFEQATRDDPQAAQAYLYIGRAYLNQGNWRDAIQPLRTAFRLAPTETQEEIVNLIIDAGFAAVFNDFRLGDRIAAPSPLKEIL